MAIATTLENYPMTIGYFRLILRCFGSTPERRQAILADTGVSEVMLRDPAADITLFQQMQQIENLNAVIGDDWALHGPELWSTPALGALGIVVISAPDVAASLNALSRFGAVRTPYDNLRLHRTAKAVVLEFVLTVPLEQAQWRPALELSFFSVREMLAALLGRLPAEAQYSFACPEPAHGARLHQLLGGSLTYDAPANTIAIPRDWLAIQSPFADATLFAQASADLENMARRLAKPADIRGRVERLLTTMPDGRLSADAVASKLGVSNRTLIRRLAEAGTGYRELLDTELRERARRLLTIGDFTRTEIAARLGYDDPSSFSRACRRWFR